MQITHAARAVLVAAPLLLAGPAAAAPDPTEVAAKEDFTELSLQELLEVQVTSVSKHAEPLRHAAGAITVVSGDELRRSGARTIAQALRLVPGLQVYRTNAQAYTVTSRGFTADKLEVLLDGRSVYSPLNSTVFWDVLDTFIDDMDRIEVIRGPGATLWGANAVNGVINIVTKHSKETVGTLVRAGAGKEESAAAAFRAGTAIGEAGYGRLYAKAFERDASHQRAGGDTFDGQRQGQAGFRTDWSPGKEHDLTVSGDFYEGRQTTKDLASNSRGEDAEVSGANLTTHWAHRLAAGSELSARFYYDGNNRLLPGTFEEHRDTASLELQYQLGLLGGAWVYGAGARISHDRTGGPPAAIIFEPDSRTLETYNAFVQAQYALGENGQLTLGSKFENNSYTGFEVQPGIRLGWELGEHAFTWGSVSRAVRLPNRFDRDIAIFCSAPISALTGCTVGTRLRIGNPDFESEKLIAYEWGLRAWTDEALTVDLTTFYNTYTDLRSTETTPPPFGTFANKIEGQGYGAELAVAWAPLDWLRVRPFYAWLQIDAEATGNSTDANTAQNLEGGAPEHSAGLAVSAAPRPDLSVDGFLRYVDELPRQQVPSYTELRLRLGWKPLPSLELALVGAELLDESHAEAGSAPSSSTPNPPPPATEVERAIWLDVIWQWK